MEKLGKQYTLETLKCKRGLLDIFLAKFGDLELKDLTIPMVIDFLTEDSHSGSWKNNFLTVVGEVYAEAPFMGLPYIPAQQFPKFRRNSIKKDVFTTDELNILFDESLWINLSSTKYANHPQFDEGHKAIYLMFLCCIKCGLRIGEAIGARVNQFLFDQGMFVVDGFYRHNQLLRINYNKCGSEEDKKIRVAPLPEDFSLIIQKYIAEKNPSGDDFVFQRYNKPIRKWLAEEWFHRDVAGETVQKIAGHTSLAMTDHYTRAAIPEMVEAVKPAVAAANKLFE